MAATHSPSSRIASLDQFRGYTVAGMFVVNYLGGFSKSWPLFSHVQHHNTHFNYADSIMPQFFFAVGFAFRMVMLRRTETMGQGAAMRQAVARGLGLILLSFMLFPPYKPGDFKTWQALKEKGAAQIATEIVKRDLWETLALIGATSIWVLPVITSSAATRIAFTAAGCALHLALAHAFYFDWTAGHPSVIDGIWPIAAKIRSFDGGPLGFLMWAVPLIVGSLAYDVVSNTSRRSAAARLVGSALLLMVVGYALSCVSTLYLESRAANESAASLSRPSPVVPPQADRTQRSWESLLAPPPFCPPSNRPVDNYWTMCKRQTTLSFMLFASGFALVVFGAFLVLSDLLGIHVGLFETLGRNPLAAYVVHELVMEGVKPFAPSDSPLWWVLASFAVFFGITWIFLNHLERSGVYLRI